MSRNLAMAAAADGAAAVALLVAVLADNRSDLEHYTLDDSISDLLLIAMARATLVFATICCGARYAALLWLLLAVCVGLLGFGVYKAVIAHLTDTAIPSELFIAGLVCFLGFGLVQVGLVLLLLCCANRRESATRVERAPLLAGGNSSSSSSNTAKRRSMFRLSQLDDENEEERDPITVALERTHSSLRERRSARGNPFAEPTAPSEDSEALQRARTNVAQEIFATETSYVSTLGMIVSVFLEPLRASAESAEPIVDRAHVKTMFLELESIHRIHLMLHGELAARMGSWAPHQRLADVFLKYTNFLRIYATYTNNFENALAAITDARRNSAFVAFLTECVQRPECGKLWLEDHLVSPIQRLPRYILLFRELRKRTPVTHPDHANINKLLPELEQLATRLNESRRQAERSLMMLQIQRMIKRCPPIVQPTRHFLNDFLCVELSSLPQPATAAAAPAAAAGSDGALDSMQSNFSHEYANVGSPQVDKTTDAVLYVFNDLVLVATHEAVQGVLSRTRESVKRVALQQDVLRPVTAGEDGVEIMHKYKFQRMCRLVDFEVRECDTPGLESCVLCRFGDNVMSYYSLQVPAERRRFVSLVQRAQLDLASSV